jgi:Na+-translocating ferredoxin:NAD+ oxidoreductase RNF subunit RnfB
MEFNKEMAMGRRDFLFKATFIGVVLAIFPSHPLLQSAIGDSEKFFVKIQSEMCNGCGECVDVCPVDVIVLKDKKAVAEKEEECLGCESCVEVCKNKAISIEEIQG